MKCGQIISLWMQGIGTKLVVFSGHFYLGSPAT